MARARMLAIDTRLYFIHCSCDMRAVVVCNSVILGHEAETGDPRRMEEEKSEMQAGQPAGDRHFIPAGLCILSMHQLVRHGRGTMCNHLSAHVATNMCLSIRQQDPASIIASILQRIVAPK